MEVFGDSPVWKINFSTWSYRFLVESNYLMKQNLLKINIYFYCFWEKHKSN